MKILKGTLQDVEELSVLFDDYRKFYGKHADLESARQFLTDRIKNNESVVFISRSAQGVLVGFVQLYPIFSSTRLTRLWLLNDLFVAPPFRGLGISVALIDVAKIFAKETDSCGLILETDKSNHVANKLYTGTGFTIDKVHNYYSWGQ